MVEKSMMLIVDDSELSQRVLSNIFCAEFDVLTASNGQEAMQCVEQYASKISIILLDIVMPKMNGIEFLQWITHSEYNELPVIAITEEAKYQLEALENGAWDFISKLSDKSIIKVRVNNVLGRYHWLQASSKQTRLYDNLINEAQDAIYVNDAQTYELLYVNATAYKVLNRTKEAILGRKCYEYLFGRTEPCEFCRLQSMKKDGFLERDFQYANSGRIYHLKGKLTNWNDVVAHVEYISDVTEQRQMELNNIALTKQLSDVVKNIPGGICLYRFDGKKISPVVHNQAFYDIFGYSEENIAKTHEETSFLNVHEEDKKELQDLIWSTFFKEGLQTVQHTYRIYNDQKKKYIWIYLNGVALPQPDGTKLAYVCYTDVTAERVMQEELNEMQLRYEVALKSSGINVWEYDITKDVLMIFSTSQRIKQNCFCIENYIESTVQNGYVREDSLPDFYDLFAQLRNGKKEVNKDLWYKTNDEQGWWCERVIYTTIFDDDGRPVKAFGAGRDVTREKEAEIHFKDEVAYREVMQSTALCSINMNITEHKIVSSSSKFAVVRELTDTGDADLYFEKTVDYIVGEENKQSFRQQFTCSKLLTLFQKGVFSTEVILPRIFDGVEMYWIRYKVHLMQRSMSNAIYAFIYSIDITQEKVMQTVMDTIAVTDYDFLVVVNGEMNSARDYAVKNGQSLFNNTEFEARMEELSRKAVCKEDRERVLAACNLQNILQHLRQHSVYKLNFSIKTPEGTVRRKQLQFTMIYEQYKTFLMTQIDVNNVFLEQAKAKEELEAALVLAKTASEAKSDFLARMSHDIRTPMNAILGLSRLAIADINDVEDTKETLQKITSAGEYLLGLLNDILDLTKIETEQLVLHKEPYSTKACIDEILVLFHNQLEEKNITFEVQSMALTEKQIMLDKLRYKQIWFNLISNAIKFTPEGGTIKLTYKQIRKENNCVTCIYCLEDNGIGMSKQFQERLFEPFTQEYKTVTSALVGSGLGLAIVQNLVRLMGGIIVVESTEYQGTRFTITLTSEIADEKAAYDSKTLEPTDLDLTGRIVLLAEDHPLNTIVARKLLERKGVTVNVVANGKLAVEDFLFSAEGYYDAILMDVRMPVLDGLRATEAIRQLARRDAKNIPIIAMTANAFEEDENKSLSAGMNAHLAKPIEPEKLYITLANLISQYRCN